MRKNIKTYLTLLVAVAGMIPMLAFASPGIPHQFYGTAIYTNGSNIASGNVIVKIGTTEVASVPINNGKYGYNPNLLFITDPDNNRTGSILKFFIGTTDTGKTAVFVNGDYTNLNLDTLVASTSTSTPTPAPASGGGGGSGINNPTPTPTPQVLGASIKKGDANGDDKVDKYDFALMMANWGKTGDNNSDFNSDGKVDKYDFALLMSNWEL